MHARDADLTRRMIRSKSNNIFTLSHEQFARIRSGYCCDIIPEGVLVLCNDDLYIYLQKRFIHLKFCGCDISTSNGCSNK